MTDSSDRFMDDDNDVIHVLPTSKEVGQRRHKFHRKVATAGIAVGAFLILFGLIADSALVFWWGALTAIVTIFGVQRYCYRHDCRAFTQSR